MLSTLAFPFSIGPGASRFIPLAYLPRSAGGAAFVGDLGMAHNNQWTNGPSEEERFWKYVEKTDDLCWIWVGARDQRGYGRFYSSRRMFSAHRFSYEMHVCPIPDGLTIDHLCRRHSCVNPAHLEAVSMRENALRGIGVTAVNAKKTNCPKGHPLSGDNLAIGPRKGERGYRRCKRCLRDWWHASRATLAEEGKHV